MRKRRTQGQQAAASGVSLWAFLTHFKACSGGDWINLSRLPADHAGEALLWLGF